MAKNVKEVRETIGVNDKNISVAAYEPRITVIELGKYKFDENSNHSLRDIESNQLEEGMVIAVGNGGNPNKDRDEMDK